MPLRKHRRYRGACAMRNKNRTARKRSHSSDECEPVDGDVSCQLESYEDIKSFFRGTVTFNQHFEAQQYNRDKYAAGMLVLQEMGIEISQNARVRALAASWARHDHEFANSLLTDSDNFGLVEVLKAVTLLDAARLARSKVKKMRLLENNQAKTSAVKLGKLKSDIDNLTAIKPSHGSVSGALSRHIRRWVRTFTQDQLEFFALYFPKDPWMKLADICHLVPTKDFPQLPWFLPYCFGAPAPDGTMVQRCDTITADNVNSLVQEFDIPYTYLHKLKLPLSEASLARIANYTPCLDTILWYYEEIKCSPVDDIIAERVGRGDPITLAIGKLLERLLTLSKMKNARHDKRKGKKKDIVADVPFFDQLIDLAEPKLSCVKLELASPIVVIGDRSGSMQVAIDTSVIIAGVLTALTSAKLVFFNTANCDAPFLPTNIREVLELCRQIQATGGTSPAASLWPFYSKQEIVKTFIIVTDEEENTKYDDYMFAPLFEKYHSEVYPARLVFVSFLPQHRTGDMTPLLSRYKPLQFVLDRHKPDLTKLDTLFGLLSSENCNFSEKLDYRTADIREMGLKKIFDGLQMK